MATDVTHSDGENELSLAFSVDTHILRELGALLVGRDSTAVVELIKNAYDADATHVVLHGESLTEHGTITVSDDGHGMTIEDFSEKFLRIAGRSKEGSQRRSPRFRRRYTGAKGIGRLSAHKLGEAMQLESIPSTRVYDRGAHVEGFRATINWRAIEDSPASIEQAKEIVVQPHDDNSDTVSRQGTTLTISSLFSPWKGAQLSAFLSEVRSTRPDPALLTPPPLRVFPGDSLLGSIRVADADRSDPGFGIELSGEFAGSDSQWPTLLAHVTWMIEIDAREEQIVYRLTPAQVVHDLNSMAEAREFSYARKQTGPEFVARIFVRDGAAGKPRTLPDILTRFAREAAGVRLFMEGFRVLPYGAPRNDWLGLDDDYSSRRSLYVQDDGIETQGNDERTYLLSNSSYFGGVYLQHQSSGGLEMVVNREGFLPGEAMNDLVENVRRGIQLSVRYRAAIGEVSKQERDAEAKRKLEEENASLLESIPLQPEGDADRSSSAKKLARWLSAGAQAAASLREERAISASPEISRHVKVVSAAIDELRSATDLAREEQAQLRILASLGTQIGAFVHEVNGVLGQALIVRDMLDKMLDQPGSPEQMRSLRAVRRATNEMIAALERQAVYLSDSLGAEARRRRSRQPIQARVATAVRLQGSAAATRHVSIEDATAPGIKTPPMFAAEVNVILANLLSNAIKAAASTADPGGTVRVSADRTGDSVRILVSNTGARVEPQDVERWFRPFETTTTEVDMVLGQGLGLGLPLTRRIVEEYGGSIKFVESEDGFETTVEVLLPNR